MQDDFQYKYQRQRIKKELQKYSISELKDICFDLGVNHEDLTGYTNSSRLDIRRELQAYMERQEQSSELMSYLLKRSKQKSSERKKRRHPIKKYKSKEEAHTAMAVKLHETIFKRLNQWLTYYLSSCLIVGLSMFIYATFQNQLLYQIFLNTLIGIAIIPLLSIFALSWFRRWISEEARRQKFYDIPKVVDRQHSKDKLYEILRGQYKQPMKFFLIRIATYLLPERKDRKRL